MTNQEIRAWYQQQTSEISRLNSQWMAQQLSSEERARRAWRIRHKARLQARSRMENPAEVEALRERDRKLHGNPDGPTFDQLVQEYRKTGLDDNAVYERIIAGAQTTNEGIDRGLRTRGPDV